MNLERHQAPGARSRGERGTSTLEVTGMLPVIAVVLVLLLHAGFIVHGITAAQTAARQGARAASLGQSPAVAVDSALPGWLPATTSTFGPGHGVRVEVDVPDLVPGTSLTVTRTAVMPE